MVGFGYEKLFVRNGTVIYEYILGIPLKCHIMYCQYKWFLSFFDCFQKIWTEIRWMKNIVIVVLDCLLGYIVVGQGIYAALDTIVFREVYGFVLVPVGLCDIMVFAISHRYVGNKFVGRQVVH